MFKRILVLIISVFVASSLAACSATDNLNSSGAAAKSALNTVLDKSIATFEADGGSETIQVEGAQYALIYVPSAPEGKRVVTADISDKNSPAYGQESSIALNTFPEMVASPAFENATFNLSSNTFTITGEEFQVTMRVRDDLIITTTLESKTAGASAKQVIMTTYGLSDEAMAIYDSAK